MSDADPEAVVIETFTGGRFRPFDPAPADVRLADVAGGLAHVCRYGGHCRRFYSVAQHSLHVSAELADREPRVQAYGLLHDAAEAYLGDVPRPIKRHLDGFAEAEDAILEAVWAAVDLPPPDPSAWEAVMAADDRLLAYEADELLADGTWAPAPPDREYDLRSDSIEAVRERFRDRAATLVSAAGGSVAGVDTV